MRSNVRTHRKGLRVTRTWGAGTCKIICRRTGGDSDADAGHRLDGEESSYCNNGPKFPDVDESGLGVLSENSEGWMESVDDEWGEMVVRVRRQVVTDRAMNCS